MVARRLSDSQKSELVERYRAGDTTASLAQAYGCSPNTVSRTVKALLSPTDYAALKAAARVKGGAGTNDDSDCDQASGSSVDSSAAEPESTMAEQSLMQKASPDGEGSDELDLSEEGSGPLALDDADDFGDEHEHDSSEDDDLDVEMADEPAVEVFHEVVPLTTGHALVEQRQANAVPFLPGVLPGSVYMLVDKTVELDARPLKEFPELGLLAAGEEELQALCLYASPRAAKRQCGRSQRVIKVPDTQVFALSTPYLLARGITRLVLEGSLIALDSSSS
ncbi:MAG: helix-turn-helix domain-containing protein [Prochlorococcus sp.]|jgi:hypothetical protein